MTPSMRPRPVADQTRTKKVIGIIGGSGPEAGADLFHKLLALHRTKLGKELYRSDRDAPDIVLMSVPALGGPRTGIDMIPGHNEGSYDESLHALLDTVQRMVPLVDVFCLACNTLHVFEPQIKDTIRGMGIEDPSTIFVSIIESTISACRARLDALQDENARISILGGPPTMDLDGISSYKHLRDELGTDIIHVPPPLAIGVLQRIIWQIKEDGKAPTSGEALEDYMTLLKDISKCKVAICVLACTELPLIHEGGILLGGSVGGADDDGKVLVPTKNMEFVDPTEVVANAVLDATHSYP